MFDLYFDRKTFHFAILKSLGTIHILGLSNYEARELQILPQVLSNLNTTTEKSKYLYYYHFDFYSK